MSSLRRQRGTFGSNKKPFAGGESIIDLRFAEVNIRLARQDHNLAKSRYDFGKMMEDFKREEEWKRLTAPGESEKRMEARRAARLAPSGPENEHPSRAGHMTDLALQARIGRNRADPTASIKRPGRENPLLVDRRLSMGHFNSTSPRNSILSAGASQV